MEIRNSSPTQNFGAKYISTTKIKEKIPFTPFYKKIDVDFVELEHKHDIPSIKAYVVKDPYSALGAEILTDLRNSPCNNYRAFALTRQHKGHKELNPNEIIGLCDGSYTCDWRDGNIFFINHLETKSKNNKSRKPDKKLISIFGFHFKVSDKSLDAIQLESVKSAESFYEHLGFTNDSINPSYYRLPYDKFGRLNKF